jgi:hypothetical protein
MRAGRLIVRDPTTRLTLRQRNQALASRWAGWIAAVAIIAVLFLPQVTAAAMALFGGLLLGYAPVVLWIAWVIRPDQHRGEWL